MDAATHLSRAEQLLDYATDAGAPEAAAIDRDAVQLAIGHALIAIGDILGVAHPAAAPAGDSNVG